jgi:hypothetical protein
MAEKWKGHQPCTEEAKHRMALLYNNLLLKELTHSKTAAVTASEGGVLMT